MKTLEELQAIRDKMKAKINNRGIAGSNDYRIVVGMATCGIAAGARNTLNAITEEIEAKHITNAIVSQTGCIGICQYEPVVEIFQAGKEKVTYVKMTPERAAEVIEKHIKGGKIVEEYTFAAAQNA